MRPPSAAGIPGIYLPPVQPLAGGNQYGGFPVNPFPTAPKAPNLSAAFAGVKPQPTPQINLGYTNPKFSNVNPVENKPVSSRQVIDRPGGLDFPITQTTPAVRPNPQTTVNPVNVPGTDFADTNTGSDILLRTPVSRITAPNYPVTTPSMNLGATPALTPLSGMSLSQVTPAGSPVDILQRTPVAPAPAPAPSGGINTRVGGGGINPISDIRNKQNIQPLAQKPINPKSGNALYDVSNMVGQYIGGKLRPQDGAAPLPEDQPNIPIKDQGQAPWEMGVSPFAQQAPPQPFGQDLRNAQTTVNIPFGQVTPNDLRDQADQQFGQPYDPNQPFPKSDERSKKNVKGYVSSPREAKQDIQPAGQVLASSDPTEATRAYWRPVVDATTEQPRQFPQFSMSAPPIVPGRAREEYGFSPRFGNVSDEAALRRPEVDLRPAQGYSYEYKDTSMPGTKPGRQFGPMAQDLEKTPAGASVVETDPRTGMKAVDTSRLTMVNTAAISEQQRKLDELMALLDDANLRASKDTGPRSGRF